MGYRDHHVLVGIEVLGVELLLGEGDLSAAGVAEPGLELHALLLDDGELLGVAREYLLAAGDELLELVVFVLQFLLLESGELAEAHGHDGGRLLGVEAVFLDECGLGSVGSARRAYRRYDLVDYVDGLEQSFEDVGPGLGLLEFEPGAADDDLVAEIHEDGYHLLEGQRPGPPVHERHVID